MPKVIGNWELGIGNWELGIGNWELGSNAPCPIGVNNRLKPLVSLVHSQV
ncbi:hypothetical protein [Microcoleus sp.]